MKRSIRTLALGLLMVAGSAATISAQSASDYEAAIYAACAREGCDGAQLVRVMYCESGGNHAAIGPHGERGIFQFHPQGLWPSIAWADPYTQIAVAADAFANGLGWNWVCQ